MGDGQQRVIGHTERSGEHVGRTTRQHAEGGIAPRQTCRHFVDRAVATESDNGIHTAEHGVGGKAGGVATFAGFDHLHVVMAGKVLVHLHGVAWGHRGGKRIDDQQDLHAIARYLRPMGH